MPNKKHYNENFFIKFQYFCFMCTTAWEKSDKGLNPRSAIYFEGCFTCVKTPSMHTVQVCQPEAGVSVTEFSRPNA